MRKTPEQILSEIHEEEKSEQRGKLKIFLGAAPGVGKTYTMLQEAAAQRKEGVDVVAGIIETHKRKETAELQQGIPELPRLSIPYLNQTYLEFDLDAALKRRPQLLLVDEMAHTNIPGCRHGKRWQDIEELLECGINVYTTLNIQHVESVNDVVAQITGIVIRETVPDSMIQKADSIELVDLTPEDLLKRLKEGKIYFPEQAHLAMQNFFKPSNLTALRELALRMTAERVNLQLLSQRKLQSAETPWATSERFLVLIGKEPSAAKLIRTAYRFADQEASWTVLFIDRRNHKLTEKERNTVLQNLRLAEQLGGETQFLTAENYDAKDVLNFARERNITQILMGKPKHSRFRRWLLGSFVDDLIQMSGDIDICLIQHDQAPDQPPDQSTVPHTTDAIRLRRSKIQWREYGLTLLMLILCTLISIPITALYQGIHVIVIYVLGMVFISARGNRGAALFGSVISAILYEFFLTAPRFSFQADHWPSLINIFALLLTSVVISHLSAVNHKQTEIAKIRQYRTATLYSLSQKLAKARGTQAMLHVALQNLCEIFDAHVAVFLPQVNQRLDLYMSYPEDVPISAKERSIAYWVFDLGQPAGLGTQTLSFSAAIYVALNGANNVRLGVLRVEPKDRSRFLLPEQLHLLDALSHQIGMALEVAKLQQTAPAAVPVVTDTANESSSPTT